MRFLSLLVIFSAAALLAQGSGKTVTFLSGSDSVSAYLAVPKGKGPFPGLVVIHEWWGLNGWVKEKTDDFAKKGYAALAVDLYRSKVAQDPELAHELMRGLPQDQALRDLKAGLAHLRAQKNVNPAKVGVIGWCMGGGFSLQLALNADPAAAVMCYGQLVTDTATLKNFKVPLLGIFGGEDRGIPAASVKAFEGTLASVGHPGRMVVYPGVGHAFMNPNNKAGYSEPRAKEAWVEIDAFFKKQLQ